MEVQWQQKEYWSRDGGRGKKVVNHKQLGKEISKQSFPGHAEYKKLQYSFERWLSISTWVPTAFTPFLCPYSLYYTWVFRVGAMPML